MKHFYLGIATFLFSSGAGATNYYVDGVGGSDAINSGQTPTSPYKTLSKAANLTLPGDTVFIMNTTGSYVYTSSGSVLTINRSGDAGAQIVYTNFPGQQPKLQASATSYAVLNVAPLTAYVTINGLEIIGNAVNLSLGADTAAAKMQLQCTTVGVGSPTENPIQKYNGHGITGDSRNSPVGTGIHHIVVSNNKIHDNCAAGVGFLRADYITIENNIIYNNSWYTIYGTSGISFNNSYNFDNNLTTYRNIVRNNISYGNRMYVPFRLDCKISDGNGIILDIPETNYEGKSLVANNICFNNGGSGIHSFRMKHVNIVHNVSYLNSASPELNSPNIYALDADDIKIMNNIIVARPGKKMNGVNNTTNLVYDYNIFSGGNAYELVGPHSIIQDPKFMNPSTDPAVANFRLQSGSLAVNAGNNALTSTTDFVGNPRPAGGTVDMGAYESVFLGSGLNCSGSTASYIIGTGNGLGEANATIFYGMADTKPSVSGQKSRKAIMYPASLLTTIPNNSIITGLRFRRALQVSTTNTTHTTQTLPDNSSFKIYVRNETIDNFGTAALDWTTVLPESANPSTYVYGGDASPIVGNAGGWRDGFFQLPFTYTGGSIGVFIEYLQGGSITGASDINWIYDNSGSQPAYSTTNFPMAINGYKANNATGTVALSNNLATSNERRPVVTFAYCPSGALPVTLLGFNSILKNNKVALNWATATETNNVGFSIQRSANGTLFETIGHTAPNTPGGNSTTKQNYMFDDLQPLNGKSYYRLVQQAVSGRLVYSGIITILISSKAANSLSIYPNPVGDKIVAQITTQSASQQATILVQDISGRTVTTLRTSLLAGANSVLLDAGNLSKGSYQYVVVLPNGEKLLSRFVKQ